VFKALYFTNKVRMYVKINYKNVSIVTAGFSHVNGN